MLCSRDHWIIKNGEIVNATFDEWGIWYENYSNRMIQEDILGDSLLMTVFFGVNISYDDEIKLFGTGVRIGNDIRELEIHSTTIEQAERVHDKWVRQMNKASGIGEK